MSFSVRLFVGVMLLVGGTAWIAHSSIRSEFEPVMRQSLEEVLIDTANLLAVIVGDELAAHANVDRTFAAQMSAFAERRFDAVVYGLRKTEPQMIVYVTDATGRVVYDSQGVDVGVDYSQWNDVHRTLRGEYGARSTRVRPEDESSSVMYVAAPVMRDGELIGVLSVGKPGSVVDPFLDAARSTLLRRGMWLLAVASIIAGLMSVGLTWPIRKLTQYAEAVRAGKRVARPAVSGRELHRLADAMESMRVELEGKQYVEEYLHGLTHELKSPLAAIGGAAELLDEEMPQRDRARFIVNIRRESARLHEIVERLLQLAAVEARGALEQTQLFETATIVEQLCRDRQVKMDGRQLRCERELQPLEVEGEPFLIRQSVGNLLDNAIDFSPDGGTLELTSRRVGGDWVLCVRDHGPGIPEYAAGRLFERFYSLPRPNDRPKSTGMGLTAVREVAQLHQGTIRVENHPDGGAVATLRIPVRAGR